MKALVYLGRHQIEVRDVPEPRPGNEDILVSVEATGICGSDMHGYHGRDPRRVPPLVMGHEICGRALTGALAGRRVAVNPQIPCSACERCQEGRTNLCMSRQSVGVDRSGGFADFVAVPERNLVPVPEGMDPAIAALAEPAATALHAIALAMRSVQKPLTGVRCLVIGGGAIGLLSALWLRALGARAINLAETHVRRRTMAEREGFNAFDPASTAIPPNSDDLAIDAVGSAQTREMALGVLRPGGTLVHVGLLEAAGGLDMKRITLAEIAVLGAFTYTRQEMGEAVAGLARGDLGSLGWIARRSLDEGPAAFADLGKAEIGEPKVILCPTARQDSARIFG